MDRHPANYNTVRILAPVVPFYDHATAAVHHRHIAGGPGPGPGPGGGANLYAQPILVPAHHQPTAYQLYHTRAFSTVNPAKMSKSAFIYQQQHHHHHHQMAESKTQSSTLNTWFTWKRKPKATLPTGTAQRSSGHTCQHHQSEASKSVVPPSLARLFSQPNGRSASVKVTSRCICSGLTESTFMAPSYFEEDDSECPKQRRKSVDENSAKVNNKCKSKSKTLRAIKASKSGKDGDSNGTLRAISTGSLLVADSSPVSRPYSTLNLNRLNQAKSCDHLQRSALAHSQEKSCRKSILECDVNPYELLDTRKTSKSKVKCATVAAKSSRRSQSQAKSSPSAVHYDSIDCIEPGNEFTLRQNGHSRTALHKGIFDPANSIRIAGQSVYSSINFTGGELMLQEQTTTTTVTTTIQSKFKSSFDVNQQPEQTSHSRSLHRSKSITSLSEWSFDSATSANAQGSCITEPVARSNIVTKVANFHSVLIEPEPDYDMDDDTLIAEELCHLPITTKSMDRLDLLATRIGEGNRVNGDGRGHTCGRRRRSSSVTRPKVNPPPPPEPSCQPPPPPPPPPANFFNSPSSSPSDSLSVSTSSLTATLSSLKTPAKPLTKASLQPDSFSFQNELKEKLNQGVKSILKKTSTSRPRPSAASTDSDCSTNENTDSLESSDSCGSVENRIQAFEMSVASETSGSASKPKKHVHFRMKRAGMSRSRSTSHLITETIHEEDDEHNFYDDVALPNGSAITATRSFDDISIVSISSTASIPAPPRRHGSHAPADAEVTASNEHHLGQHRPTSASTDHRISNSAPQPSADLFADSLAHLDGRSHLGKSETLTGGNRGNRSGDSAGRTCSQPSAAAYSDAPEANTSPSCATLLSAHGDLSPRPNGSHHHEVNSDEDSSLKLVRAKFSPRRSNHHFDTSCSPTPPPIPARRLINASPTVPSSVSPPEENADQPTGKKNSFSRTVRSYSSGSVRSLLARKLSRSTSGNSARLGGQPNGPKLALSHLFSKSANEEQPDEPQTSCSGKNDQVDEHIYEELDSLFVDAHASTPHKSSSLFGARISRAEILDYLHDARGRLAKQETVVGGGGTKPEEHNPEHAEEDNRDLSEIVSPIAATISAADLAELNNDSGNSSFVDTIEYSDTFIPGLAKSRMRKARARNTSADQSATAAGSQGSTPLSTGAVVNRRNRVSNVSNSSSESSATSGVSGVSSSLSDDVEEDDLITNSSSSLGSIANEGSAGSASCYYGTCGSLGSGAGLPTGTPTSTVLERNDSGVGAEISSAKCLLAKSSVSSGDLPPVASDRLSTICFDCDLESLDSSDSAPYAYRSNLCHRCEKRRNERKEIISEIVDTELKYGRDLKIIQEEFARPISVAGLLTGQQVDEIFLNLDELIEVNEHFAEQLQDALECAYEQDDEDLTTVSIGQLFHDCLLARISVFEQYCIRQGSASLLLNQLEKEKELLRIFLRVSQMENTLLRRMNLRSFLVVPVQRVTKYPLLLNRLHKVTSHHHPDRESLHEAQVKMEFHLESINQKTRGSIAATTSRIWRRISNLSSASIRSKAAASDHYLDDFGYVRLKKTALDLLKWPKEESRFALIGKLSYIVEKSGTSSEQINLSSTYASQNGSSVSIFNNTLATNATASSSSFWSRTLKFSSAHAILVTLTSTAESENASPSEPTSLTLFDQVAYSESGGEPLSDSTRFNSTSRRASSKSPSRVVHSGSMAAANSAAKGATIREAALLLFKEKSGRYVLCRDTLNLAMCVIANATEVESDEFFEIHELESRESLLLKAETHSETKEWLEQLRQHSSGLGNWRRRRNALPNIMVLRSVVDQQF